MGEEKRCDRRRIQVGHVRVPNGFAAAEAADGPSVRSNDIRDDIDLGLVGDGGPAVFHDRRQIQLAETAAEGKQVVVRQLLPAEKKCRVIEPSRINRVELAVRQAREIYSRNLRPYRFRQRRDGRDSRVTRRVSLSPR